jgi:hypothetical protein
MEALEVSMSEDIHNIETDMFDKVDELLADTGKLNIQTALRLNLSLQKQTAEGVNNIVNHIKVQNGRIAKLEAQTSELMNKNIINWVIKNQKLSVLYFFLFVLFIDIIVDRMSSANSLEMLNAVIKKFLGI